MTPFVMTPFVMTPFVMTPFTISIKIMPFYIILVNTFKITFFICYKCKTKVIIPNNR